MKTPTIVLAVAAALLVLSGCGMGQETETEAPAPAPESSTESEASTEPSEEESDGQPSQGQVPGTSDASGTVTVDGTESDLGELQCVVTPDGAIITSVSPTAEQGFALQIQGETVTSFTVTIDSRPLIFAEGVGSGGELSVSVSDQTYSVTGTLPDLAAGGEQVEVSAEVTCG